jgi:hypothetical protein
MRAPMRYFVLVAMLAAGCGKQIGDACIVSSDCDPNGQRACDPSQKGGYCTIVGCDYNTCPTEAACIRFFTGQFDNKLCDPTTEDKTTDDCSLDELCDLEGHCVSRSSEIRYCMLKCSTDGDCRDGYECRTLDLMKAHGGEPVLAPGVPVDEHAPKFCAEKPAT